jgi:hypothetical protein
MENVDFIRTSALSGKTRTKTFRVKSKDLYDFFHGKHVQEAFPYLDDNEREFILTGITEEEWDEAFGDIG